MRHRTPGIGVVMHIVYTYRVGGGPERRYSVVVTLDALPPWTTLAQLEHLAKHSSPKSNHWVLRSGGLRSTAKAMACVRFERAVAIQTSWAKTLSHDEQIAMGRLAPPDIAEQVEW